MIMKMMKNGGENAERFVVALRTRMQMMPRVIVAIVRRSVCQCVTLAPPNLSDIIPPTGRMREPIMAPRKAGEKPLPGEFGSEQSCFDGSASMAAAQSSEPSSSKRSRISFGNAFENLMKEPKVIM